MDRRKRIRPLESTPPKCPHCVQPDTGVPIEMVETLNEMGYSKLACPACGLVACEVLAGDHPICNRCGARMQVASALISEGASMVEFACPVCDLGSKAVQQ